MTFSPQFESEYIRQFAGIVQRGASALAWSDWTERIRDALSKIGDTMVRADAQERFARIISYGSILSEDPNGSRDFVAAELERFADFFGAI